MMTVYSQRGVFRVEQLLELLQFIKSFSSDGSSVSRQVMASMESEGFNL